MRIYEDSKRGVAQHIANRAVVLLREEGMSYEDLIQCQPEGVEPVSWLVDLVEWGLDLESQKFVVDPSTAPPVPSRFISDGPSTGIEIIYGCLGTATEAYFTSRARS